VKGQVSIEFILLLGFMVVVFIAFVVVIQGQIRDQQQVRQLSLYSQLADKVEREVLLAERVNPGYSREFDLPLTLDGEPYNLTLEGKDTIVIRGNYSENEYIRFLSSNVTGIETNGVPAVGTYVLLPANKLSVIIQKNSSGIFFRKDCVQNGMNASACV